mgnify:CR=1 FL=1
MPSKREEAVPKITKRFVDTAEPRAEKWIAWDDDLAGFGLSVMPSGVKSYVLRYRTTEGRDRRLTIGRHGVLTPDLARQQAKELLLGVTKGGDPLGDRRGRRAGATMADLFDRYLEEHVAVRLSPRTAKEQRRIVEKHLRPEFQGLKVEGFTSQDARRLHFAMRKTPRQANYTLGILSKALSLAEEWGMRPEGRNPCSRIDKYPEASRDRFLTPVEVERLGRTLIDAETIGLPWVLDEDDEPSKHLAKPENRRTAVDPTAVAVVRLLLLTGARLSEITELEWGHVDFERGTIALPHQKGRARRAHVVPTAAMDLLARRPRVEGSPWVFPRATDPARTISVFVIENAWARIRTAAEMKDVRLHDLRHTVGTWAARTGANAFQIRDVLRHSGVAMTGRYVNRDDEPLRALTEIVGAALTDALEGKRAEVVPIKRGRITNT